MEVRYPPSKKGGISAILARYPMITRQMGAIPPSGILSRKGIARYRGVSRIGPLSSHILSPLLSASVDGGKASFQKGPFPRDPADWRDLVEIQEPPKSAAKQGKCDHFPDILETFRVILDIPSVL